MKGVWLATSEDAVYEPGSRSEKDVHRTDRTIPLFAGEGFGCLFHRQAACPGPADRSESPPPRARIPNRTTCIGSNISRSIEGLPESSAKVMDCYASGIP
ncbi:hypothetical protein BDV11DRAFT_176233 [Aspergillus similis]